MLAARDGDDADAQSAPRTRAALQEVDLNAGALSASGASSASSSASSAITKRKNGSNGVAGGFDIGGGINDAREAVRVDDGEVGEVEMEIEASAGRPVGGLDDLDRGLSPALSNLRLSMAERDVQTNPHTTTTAAAAAAAAASASACR